MHFESHHSAGTIVWQLDGRLPVSFMEGGWKALYNVMMLSMRDIS